MIFKEDDEWTAEDWAGHIGDEGKREPSCGCRVCTAARFDMRVRSEG